MAKARIGLYSTKGDTLTRSHKFCPKCGAGTFLAEHADRRSCGHCGYMETKPKDAQIVAPPVAAAPKPKANKPKAPKAAPAPAAPAAPTPPKAG